VCVCVCVFTLVWILWTLISVLQTCGFLSVRRTHTSCLRGVEGRVPGVQRRQHHCPDSSRAARALVAPPPAPPLLRRAGSRILLAVFRGQPNARAPIVSCCLGVVGTHRLPAGNGVGVGARAGWGVERYVPPSSRPAKDEETLCWGWRGEHFDNTQEVWVGETVVSVRMMTTVLWLSLLLQPTCNIPCFVHVDLFSSVFFCRFRHFWRVCVFWPSWHPPRRRDKSSLRTNDALLETCLGALDLLLDLSEKCGYGTVRYGTVRYGTVHLPCFAEWG